MELLHFCTSDLVTLAPTTLPREAEDTQPPRSNSGGGGGGSVVTFGDTGAGGVDAGAAAAGAGGSTSARSSGPQGGDGGDLLAELSAAVGSAQVGHIFNSALQGLSNLGLGNLGGLSELVGGLGGGMGIRPEGIASAAGSGSAGDGVREGGTNRGGRQGDHDGRGGAHAGGVRVQVDEGKLAELRGLPVPTAAGTIVALGEWGCINCV